MDIYAVLFRLLVALHPGIGLESAHNVAEDIAEAVDQRPELTDPLDVAIDLAVIASHESSLRESVRTCLRTGDKGRSIGLWQMQRHVWQGHSKQAICEDPKLAARLALEFWRKTRSFRAYAGCQPDLECKPAEEMKAMRLRFRKSAGL